MLCMKPTKGEKPQDKTIMLKASSNMLSKPLLCFPFLSDDLRLAVEI